MSKKSMVDELESLELHLKERSEQTERESWRIAYLCIKQGREAIRKAKIEDGQVLKRLEAMSIEIKMLQGKE